MSNKCDFLHMSLAKCKENTVFSTYNLGERDDG